MTVATAPDLIDMTVGQELGRDPRWNLVQRIVATPEFVRSPRLVSFLLFVAERSLNGEKEEINEQSIGVGVFGRRRGYDSNDDNIVRAHASRLRHKLDAYFLNEGTGESLRVSIPKGTYIPFFHEAPATAQSVLAAICTQSTELPTDLSVGQYSSSPLEPLPPSEPRTDAELNPFKGQASHADRFNPPPHYWLLLLGACIVCIAATYFLTVTRHRKATVGGAPEANHALWEELLDGQQKTLIVNGDSSLVIYENARGKTLSVAEYISGNYRDEVAPQDQADSHMLRTIARRRLTSIVDLDIANRITSRSELAPNHVAFRYARDLHVDDLKGANIVLIGSQEANPWVQLYSDALNFTMVPDQQTKTFTIHNRTPKAGEAVEYRSIAGDPERRAYATVAFLKNLDGTGHALIIQGTGMAGTEAAADYVLGEPTLSSLVHAGSSANTPLPDFEALLETSNLNGNAPKSKLVALRVNGK
jgi:hypothetical protein